MIMTVLWVLKKFIEFATRPRNDLEASQIDLIDSCRNSESETDSTIIYLNCNVIDLKDTGNGDTNKNMLFRKNRCGHSKRRLNLVKKMEYEEAGNRDILNSIMSGLKGNTMSPASDCNSNNLLLPKENFLLRNTESMQECPDFLQENSEYQWFLDYGYKENNQFQQQSILSLSRSQDFMYYNDMSRNIDANLAEVDMDEFNREDIHSVLSTFPSIQGAEEREMFASVSDSMMAKLGFDTSISQQSSIHEDPNNCTSICKSQLLFSPVRESYMPNANLSVDSLDLSENDINLMVTCQANKNNYTIAFEGSTVIGSDDSESRETGTSIGSTSEENEMAHCGDRLNKNSKNFACHSGNSMARSDSTFTTWTKIKENFSEHLQLRRHPSGNNNTEADATNSCEFNNSNTVKSLSLPNLCRPKEKRELVEGTNMENDTCHNDQKYKKLYDIQNGCNSRSVDHTDLSVSEKPAQNFSLLKLFMKQKSSSHERMSNNTNEQSILKDCFESRNKELRENERGKGQNDLVYHENKINANHGHCEKENFTQSKINRKKLRENDLKNDYILPREDKYYSDESTQENGSNTESAENICNCIKLPPRGGKKSIIERSIQTSIVSEPGENAQKKSWKVPVYVLYPNYSLPNLEFLKRKHYVQNIDFSKVFMRPQKFKTAESPVSSPQTNAKKPFSLKDMETLKKTGFKHVRDWESLAFLLPKEYKQFLPEIVPQLRDVKHLKEDLVPLFCLSPPTTRKLRKRPTSCDVNLFSNDCKNSNYSSTATQPSSGFRGSSTMLNSNNSGSTQSPKNPSYMNKYDSGLESGSPRKSGSLASGKNIFFNSRGSNEAISPRPPLRRSILKNNSLDNQHYTCKTQKENANKRYSMIELSERNFDAEEKLHRIRSNLNAESERAFLSKTGREEKLVESEEDYYSDDQYNFNLQNDMRRLEELLEISAVFGESVESFTESDMMRLRSQVSKFLTMHKNLEKVSETLQTVDNSNETNQNNEGKKSQETRAGDSPQLPIPHNTPEHKKQSKVKVEKDLNLELYGLVNNSNQDGFKPFDCGARGNTPDEECKFNEGALMGGLKKTVSFAEKIELGVQELELKNKERVLSSSPNLLPNNPKFHQNKAKRPVDLPICEESCEGSLKDFPSRNTLQASAELLHKRDLILDVKNAVEKILKLFEETQESPAKLCLHHLCPSLYAVLSDGLREEIDTPFGPLKNSVWNVIEASSQQDPMTQTLNELVQRLNRDDIFTEGLIKFNAFIFGLLNARALAGWFSYLRTRDSLLRKYYDNSGLLLMSNTAGALIRVLVDKLINIIEPLSSLQFNLDLMYQTKLLHSSLKNINCLLEEAENNDFLTPTKQFVLFKLVQSIQNSISQSAEGKKTKHALDNMETKTSDLPAANLLEKNKSIPVRHNSSNKVRPRSGYDILRQENGSGDVAGAMKKRWSGVQGNSKLVEAFEKLADESESDYTDSLDVAKPRKKHEKNVSNKNSTKKTQHEGVSRNPVGGEVDDYTKEQKKNILLNLNKKSSGKADDNKTELEKKEPFENSAASAKNGRKFIRLQQKWEKLSKKPECDSNEEVSSLERTSSKETLKSQSSQKPSCDNGSNLQSPTARISKIPRLVTSPLSSAPSTKQPGTVKKKTESPTSANQQNLKPSKSTSFGKLPTEESNNKVIPPGSSRLSRSDKSRAEKILTGAASKTQTNRPTSLPYRGSNSLPAKKFEETTRRSSSMSLNRKPPSKKLQVPRTVLTLTHRLPSDSGHLSFNEGEKLKVVLEVDKKWLLCCRGTQKGLVPKSAVISDIEDSKF